MAEEPDRLEEAKSETLAAFAAIAAVIDLSGEPETAENRSALDSSARRRRATPRSVSGDHGPGERR
jgi:hypothetical protein